MLNWYRAAVRFQMPEMKDARIRIPTLMIWGMKDVALSHRLARPSMDYCDEGNLILFPEATHWVQLDEADSVNHYLADFLLDKISTQVIR